MGTAFESNERTAPDFILFGTGFVGFLVGVTGVVVGSAGTAIAGAVILLVAIASFQLRP